VQVTTTVREAKLKPERAERYPTLPARMWTSATWMAALVASYWDGQPEFPEDERVLPEDDFEFRGSSPAEGGRRERASLRPAD
jgi:hypothetical protein